MYRYTYDNYQSIESLASMFLKKRDFCLEYLG